jgi:hypothetical protein
LHRAGAALTVLTDGDAGAAANCARNMRLNGAASACLASSVWSAAAAAPAAAGAGDAGVACCQMPWEEVAPDEDDEALGGRGMPAFDVVVASDVLYDPVCVPPFVRMLRRLLTAAQTGGDEGGGASGSNGAGGGSSGSGRDTAMPGALAYVATTRRNPRTLELFESTAAAAGLVLEGLATGPWPGRQAFQGAVALRGRDGILLHRISAPMQQG